MSRRPRSVLADVRCWSVPLAPLGDSQLCIAPMEWRSRTEAETCRCTHEITPLEVSKIHDKVVEAKGLPDSWLRDAVIGDILKLRCCRHHEYILHGQRAVLATLVRQCKEAWSELKPVRLRTADDVWIYDDPPRSPRMIPYRILLGETTQGEIKRALEPSSRLLQAREGYIYGFSTSHFPGHIKIGYGHVAERLHKWRRCFPDLVLEFQIYVPFPQLAERLIHLELRERRRVWCLCDTCGHSHVEFFNLDFRHAERVINQWKDLLEQYPLLSRDGLALHPTWATVLNELSESGMCNITAELLLDAIRHPSLISSMNRQPVGGNRENPILLDDTLPYREQQSTSTRSDPDILFQSARPLQNPAVNISRRGRRFLVDERGSIVID